MGKDGEGVYHDMCNDHKYQISELGRGVEESGGGGISKYLTIIKQLLLVYSLFLESFPWKQPVWKANRYPSLHKEEGFGVMP